MVWHDYVFAQDQIFHVAAWSTDGSHLTVTSIGDAAFDNLKRIVSVTGASRSVGVVTLTTPAAGVTKVGDTISVSLSDSTYNAVATVTTVTATSVQYAQAKPDQTGDPITGTAQDLDAVLPLWVKSQVVGNVVSIKVWRNGENEPSWDDPVAVRSFADTTGLGPVGPGEDGLYAGHLAGGAWVEYGLLDIRSLDAAATTSTTTSMTSASAALRPDHPADRIRLTPSDPEALATRTGTTQLSRVARRGALSP